MWVNYTKIKWNCYPPCTGYQMYVVRCRRHYAHPTRWPLSQLVPPTLIASPFLSFLLPARAVTHLSWMPETLGSYLYWGRQTQRKASLICQSVQSTMLGQYLVTSFYINLCDTVSLNDVRTRQPFFKTIVQNLLFFLRLVAVDFLYCYLYFFSLCVAN